jgi:hypothetical protein
MSQHRTTVPAPESAARRQVEKDYVAEVATLWQELAHGETKPSGSALAAALAVRLGLPLGAATGVLEGFQSLLQYALSEEALGSTALEEERQSVQVALVALRPVLEARLQQRLEEAEARTPEVICEQCGRRSVVQGWRRRTWLSTVGALSLQRRYAWCAPCGQGGAPAQAAIGLPASALTAGLEEVTTLLATTVPHPQAVALVQQMLGLEVSAQAVKSSVTRRAPQVIRLQDEAAQQVQDYQAKWEKSPPWLTAPAPTRAVDVAYLELDGVLVLTREETAREAAQTGRGGPGRHYEVTGREVKNAILYEDVACVQERERRAHNAGENLSLGLRDVAAAGVSDLGRAAQTRLRAGAFAGRVE